MSQHRPATTPSLFAQTHRTDPAPARAAAREHVRSGRLKTNAAAVLASVRINPGRTAKEYGHATNLGHVEAQRRLSDLANAGLIEKGEAVKCSVSGKRLTSWHPCE